MTIFYRKHEMTSVWHLYVQHNWEQSIACRLSDITSKFSIWIKSNDNTYEYVKLESVPRTVGEGTRLQVVLKLKWKLRETKKTYWVIIQLFHL